MFNKMVIPTGGGSKSINYQLTCSRGLVFVICCDGEVVSAKGNDQGTTYNDDYISVSRSSSNVSLTVKKACTLIKITNTGASTDPIIAEISCTANQTISLQFAVANTGVEFVNIEFD